jgi:hypothetical protein
MNKKMAAAPNPNDTANISARNEKIALVIAPTTNK